MSIASRTTNAAAANTPTRAVGNAGAAPKEGTGRERAPHRPSARPSERDVGGDRAVGIDAYDPGAAPLRLAHEWEIHGPGLGIVAPPETMVRELTASANSWPPGLK